ncbi:MAG: N-acetyltransferase [Alphaproteobacteria bacterium]|nr:N-acetyltransferase [Alphaproteobacteria bacterium]
MLLRAALPADLPVVTEIYAHHVLTGLASFEETPPDIAEMTARFAAVRQAGLPWLVAEAGEKILGYAYASPYRSRPAYRFTVEDSIYVADGVRRRGVGRLLLARLIEECEAAGRRQMIAIIGDSANTASIGLHAAFGFRHAANLRSVGFKFGRWVDSVIMQRPLGPGDVSLPAT